MDPLSAYPRSGDQPLHDPLGDARQSATLLAIAVQKLTAKRSAGLTFGDAIDALKQGKRVSRSGWNGKGMYLWLLPASKVKAEWCKEPHLKQLAEENGGEVEALGSIRMLTADKKVLTGWLASQTDMLAEDWTILD